MSNSSLRKLWDYWWDSAEPATVGVERITLVATFVFSLVGFVLRKKMSGDAVGNAVLVLAFLAAIRTFVWTPFKRHTALEDRQTPRIKVQCGSDIVGSRPPARGFKYGEGISKKITTAQFLRLAVTAESLGPISKAVATITKIEKSGEPKAIWEGEQDRLTFAPGEDEKSTESDLQDGVTAYVDVLVLTGTGLIYMGTLGRGWRYPAHQPNKMFDQPGDYVLSVSLSAADTKSTHCRLQFVWTGKLETSSLSLLPA